MLGIDNLVFIAILADKLPPHQRDKARLLADPTSEIEPIASLCDIVDLIEGLMVFAGHFGAVPIRYGTGLDVPRDPKDPTKPLLGPDGKPRFCINATVLEFRPRAAVVR